VIGTHHAHASVIVIAHRSSAGECFPGMIAPANALAEGAARADQLEVAWAAGNDPVVGGGAASQREPGPLSIRGCLAKRLASIDDAEVVEKALAGLVGWIGNHAADPNANRNATLREVQDHSDEVAALLDRAVGKGCPKNRADDVKSDQTSGVRICHR